MLKRIRHDDAFWDDPPFAEEAVLFNLLYLLRTAEDGLFLTDGESVLLAQSSPDKPAWIWTKGPQSGAGIEALRAACEEHGIRDAFVRPDVGARLFTGRANHRMFARHCPRLIRPEGIAGACARPGAEDIPAVAALLAAFDAHVEGRRETDERYREAAEAMAEGGDTLIWRAPDGEAAALARLARRSPRHARIGPVVTAERFRGRGYAGAVVAALCEGIVSEGRTPMLYADADYPSSNRAYEKIGFVTVGELWRVKRSDGDGTDAEKRQDAAD